MGVIFDGRHRDAKAFVIRPIPCLAKNTLLLRGPLFGTRGRRAGFPKDWNLADACALDVRVDNTPSRARRFSSSAPVRPLRKNAVSSAAPIPPEHTHALAVLTGKYGRPAPPSWSIIPSVSFARAYEIAPPWVDLEVLRGFVYAAKVEAMYAESALPPEWGSAWSVAICASVRFRCFCFWKGDRRNHARRACYAPPSEEYRKVRGATNGSLRRNPPRRSAER